VTLLLAGGATAQAAPPPELVITGLGAAHVLSPAFFGANIENAYARFSWSDPDAIYALNRDAFRNVRFPGGAFGSYYDWHKGWSWPDFEGDSMLNVSPGAASFNDTLSGLAALLGATNVLSPIYDLNTLTTFINTTGQTCPAALANPSCFQTSYFTSPAGKLACGTVRPASGTLSCGTFLTGNANVVAPPNTGSAKADQMAMLQMARQKNLPVSYIELGNEMFWVNPDFDVMYANGTDYASQMNGWIAGIRASPNTQIAHAQIAAIGVISPGGVLGTPDAGKWANGPAPGGTSWKIYDWDEDLLKTIDIQSATHQGINAITLHRYDESANAGTSAAEVLAYAFNDWAYIGQGDAALNIPGILHTIYTHGLQAWFTEFGAFKDNSGMLNNDGTWKSLPVFTGTWLKGLYTSEMIVEFLSDPRVGQISLYNLNDTYFQTSRQTYWIAANNVAGQNSGATVSMNNPSAGSLTGIGQAMSLIGPNLIGIDKAYQVSFPGVVMLNDAAPTGDGSSADPYPDITGIWLHRSIPAAPPAAVAAANPALANTTSSGAWLVLNLSGEARQLVADPGMVTVESVGSPSLMTVVITDDRSATPSLSHTLAFLDGQKAISIAPYSVNIITFYTKP
jgi:hypothetical protein